MKPRLFLALFPTASITSYLDGVMRNLQDIGPDVVRWVKPEGIHITLRFLGEVNENLVSSICKMICERVSGTKGFNLRLDSLEMFPALSTPRAICVGLSGDLDALSALRYSLEQGLAALGYLGSGLEIRPHITLGRVRRTASSSDRKNLLSNVSQVTLSGNEHLEIREVAVVKSILMQQGPKYSTIYAVQFG